MQLQSNTHKHSAIRKGAGFILPPPHNSTIYRYFSPGNVDATTIKGNHDCPCFSEFDVGHCAVDDSVQKCSRGRTSTAKLSQNMTPYFASPKTCTNEVTSTTNRGQLHQETRASRRENRNLEPAPRGKNKKMVVFLLAQRMTPRST